MKTKTKPRKTKAAACPCIDAVPLLSAFIDLAERSISEQLERLEAMLARAEAARESRIADDVRSIMCNVEAALDALPAPDFYKP